MRRGREGERERLHSEEIIKFNPPTSVSESLRIRKTSCVGVPSSSLDNGNKMVVITIKLKIKMHASLKLPPSLQLCSINGQSLTVVGSPLAGSPKDK